MGHSERASRRFSLLLASIETHQAVPGHSLDVSFSLERKMLKLLMNDVLKSPGRLLALCLVVYLASISTFVGLFLAGIAVRVVSKRIKAKAKALEAAEAEAARVLAEKAREQALSEAVQESAATETAAQPGQSTPNRQYAKSAVVIPMKRTGTD
jgi:hypothetical protein